MDDRARKPRGGMSGATESMSSTNRDAGWSVISKSSGRLAGGALNVHHVKILPFEGLNIVLETVDAAMVIMSGVR